jgi:hypothetical protein
MAGLNLNRNQAPAEVDNTPDDLRRDMQAWARAWPTVDKAMADYKKAIMEFMAKNDDLNRKAGRKLGDRGISGDQKKALEDLVARTTATHDALNRIL